VIQEKFFDLAAYELIRFILRVKVSIKKTRSITLRQLGRSVEDFLEATADALTLRMQHVEVRGSLSFYHRFVMIQTDPEVILR
jgi:hypothetical protein